MLLHQEKVKHNQAEFIANLSAISKKLSIDPNWLMAAIDLESAGTFSASIENTKSPFKDGFATGLIQFTPATARSLGTTTQDLKNMSNVQQLQYVYKYLKPYASKIKSFVDLYLTIFFPVAVGKPSNFIIAYKDLHADTIARANPLFDVNKDGKITVAEIQNVLLERVPKDLWASFKKKDSL